MKWRSMDAAPTDGTEVLGTTTEEDVVFVRWNARAEMWQCHTVLLHPDRLRAWMPKPAPYTGPFWELDAECGDA